MTREEALKNVRLKIEQWNKAMAGDAEMLILLGKQRLGQREPPTQGTQATEEIVAAIEKLELPE